MSGGDFLFRWSKRKRAVARPEPSTDAAVESADGTREAPPPAHGEEAGLLPAEELAKLPSIESLTAETDLTQFLRAGVPMVMRKAALRRMWSLDTNIRDYVSEAREYAYDWNVAGGVPGSGPMLPTDDIKAMLRDIFDGTPGAEVESEPEAPDTTTGGIDDTVAASSAPAASEEIADHSELEPLVVALPNPEPDPLLTERRTSAEAAPAPRPRRHGGAAPL